MAFEKYPGKRYHASGETKYIESAADESADWFDSPKKAAAKPAKAEKPGKVEKPSIAEA